MAIPWHPDRRGLVNDGLNEAHAQATLALNGGETTGFPGDSTDTMQDVLEQLITLKAKIEGIPNT